ncbi:Hypothetical protein FKW44_017161, partial [Caligus rogercresseyi]
TKEFLAKKGIKVIDHPPYSPDLPRRLLLLPCHEEDARGRGDRRQERPEGVAIPEDRFREAFRKWVERWEKCIRIGGSHV